MGLIRTTFALAAAALGFAGCGGGSGGGAPPLTTALDFAWARMAGNDGNTVGTDVATYPDGSLVAVGVYDGNIQFSPGTTPPKTLAAGPGLGMYLARYDLNGGIYWVRRVVSSGSVQAMGVVTHASGEFTVTGFFTGSATFGEGETLQTVLTASGGEDLFVARYLKSGSLLWAEQSVGAGYEEATRIAARADGSVVITGLLTDTTTLGLGEANETTLPASPFGVAGFLACYQPSGLLLWAKTFDASGGSAAGWGVAVFSDGGVAVCGSYSGDAVFGPGVGLTGIGASLDVFVARFDAAGNAVWARSAGGAGDDVGYSVTVVPGDFVRLVGVFGGSADFGTESPAPQALLGYGDVTDAFAAGYDGTGLFQWATAFGSTGYDFATSVASFSDGTFAVTGTFAGDATFGLGEIGEQHASTTSLQDHEVFVVRFQPDGAVDWVITSQGVDGSDNQGTAVVAGPDDTVLVTGYFIDRLTFAPGFFLGGHTGASLGGVGDHDAFVARFNSNGVFFPQQP